MSGKRLPNRTPPRQLKIRKIDEEENVENEENEENVDWRGVIVEYPSSSAASSAAGPVTNPVTPPRIITSIGPSLQLEVVSNPASSSLHSSTIPQINLLSTPQGQIGRLRLQASSAASPEAILSPTEKVRILGDNYPPEMNERFQLLISLAPYKRFVRFILPYKSDANAQKAKYDEINNRLRLFAQKNNIPKILKTKTTEIEKIIIKENYLA